MGGVEQTSGPAHQPDQAMPCQTSTIYSGYRGLVV